MNLNIILKYQNLSNCAKNKLVYGDTAKLALTHDYYWPLSYAGYTGLVRARNGLSLLNRGNIEIGFRVSGFNSGAWWDDTSTDPEEYQRIFVKLCRLFKEIMGYDYEL